MVNARWHLSEAWNDLADRLPPRISPDPRWSGLTAAWNARYPECRPVGHELLGYADLWVRFHSLPNAKRYAESQAEYMEVLHRHHAVLNALAQGGGQLLAVTVSSNQSRFPRRRPYRLARLTPGASLWQSLLYETDDDGQVWWHLFVSPAA